MTWEECRFLIRSDLFRCGQGGGKRVFFREVVRSEPGFRYMVLLRLCAWLRSIRGGRYLQLPLRAWLRRYQVKYGINIPYNTRLGAGFSIGHFGGIVINPEATFGWNCTISHNVTIGATYGGKHPGVPSIGDRVYIGPGAKIVGRLTVGDDAVIGANTVVTRDVPPKGVVFGVPGQLVGDYGSGDYVVNIVDRPAAYTGDSVVNAADWPAEEGSASACGP